jgi:IS5 family transposase
MLRDRYEPMNVFALVPPLRMALDPVLTPLDRVLDDDTLFQAVTVDLARRWPRPRTDGRPSTPVEGMLRLLVVKHLSGWSDEATARWGRESLVLCPCCRVYVAPVPADTTLLRGATLLQPATRQRRLDHIVRLARSLQVTRGRQRRIDGTVVATNMHPPTASPWRSDGVRGLGRTLANARAVLQKTAGRGREAVRDRTRRAKRQRKRRMAAARQRGTEAADRMRTAYPPLRDIAQATVPYAHRVGTVLTTQATAPGQHLAAPLAHMVPLVGQVLSQTTRRMMQGEAVPASEKVVRLFEPHTASIRTGKPGKPTACGRVLWLDAVEGGSIRRYAVLAGQPPEDAQLPPSVDHHRRVVHRPPRLLAGERGVHSTATER